MIPSPVSPRLNGHLRFLANSTRDEAHKALWQNPRILHRDISPGNILIVDTDLCQAGFVGFLHDFHHSSMAAGGVSRLASFESDRSVDYVS